MALDDEIAAKAEIERAGRLIKPDEKAHIENYSDRHGDTFVRSKQFWDERHRCACEFGPPIRPFTAAMTAYAKALDGLLDAKSRRLDPFARTVRGTSLH